MKDEQKAFMIFLISVMLGMTLLSLRFSPGSRMLPMVSGICASAIAAFLILMSFSPRTASWYGRLEKKSLFSAETMTNEERKKEVSIVAWFLGCSILIYLVGFMIAIPLFLFMFLKWRAKEGWVLSVVVPCVVAAVVYFAFIWILRVPLYKGVFFE